MSFGSYYLGTVTINGDIDCVCVAPHNITREKHFFKDLYEKLKTELVLDKLNKIEQAYAPIINLVY